MGCSVGVRRYRIRIDTDSRLHDKDAASAAVASGQCLEGGAGGRGRKVVFTGCLVLFVFLVFKHVFVFFVCY